MSSERSSQRSSPRQDALSRLVNLEPQQLCSEAIIENCRATRDLRNCGRMVQHILTSCGHASLCCECSQRCDVCPICRVPIRKHESIMCLRLYEECVEAGLITSREEEFRERDGLFNTDVQRLWSFFDVALENKLVSVVSHYVSDVCMDDGAVSSNAIVSMLLDGTVVKEWCKKTFLHIVRSLRDLYNLGTKQMEGKMGVLEKIGMKLSGLMHILECLEAPISDAASTPVLELQQILEGVRRVFQHLEVMCWCARHQFLENVPSCHSSISNWRSTVRGRKSAANDRAWPERTRNAWQTSSGQSSTLFIEDAMINVGYGKDHEEEFLRDNLELGLLRHGSPTPPAPFRRREATAVQSAMHGSSLMYPPESVRMAVDFLFLEASADLILAKKAIFSYYLFDRHWPQSKGEWRRVVDDYMHAFDIPEDVMLESFLFYLLDNNNDAALEEACHLLPEVVSCKTHPKVARVLLERQKPKAALDLLQCSTQGGRLNVSGSMNNLDSVDLVDAITAVRVRLECGLLTEAYLYQRAHTSRVKEQVMKHTMLKLKSRVPKDGNGDRCWRTEMEVLVGEICWLCIRKNLVDKLMELPWQSDEEIVVRNCLLEQATEDPSSPAGSLMVVSYIMRCRNVEAYLVHKRLCATEKAYMDHSGDEGKNSCLRNICAQRTLLVEKCIELLPEIQRHQLQNGALDAMLPVSSVYTNKEHAQTRHSNLSDGKKSIEMLPEKQRHQVLDAILPISSMAIHKASPSRPMNVDTKNLFSSEGVQASPSVSPFEFNGRSESSFLSHRTSPDMPIRWGDFRQPSILHGNPSFKTSPGGSTLRSQLDQPTHGDPASQRESGQGLVSPILGRKLSYNGESDFTSYAIRKSTRNSHQKLSSVLDHPRDDTKGNTYHEDRDPPLIAPQHLASESQGENELSGRIWSYGNSELMQSEITGTCVLERAQNGGVHPSENGIFGTASTPTSLRFRQTENGAHGNREILGEDCKLSLSSSSAGFKNTPRKQLLHASPNGKRKADGRLEACQLDVFSEVALEGAGGLFHDNSQKSSLHQLQQGLSQETDPETFRSQRISSLRWRAEDGGLESSSVSIPAGKNKSVSNMGRTISGSRSFRSYAM